MSAPPLLVGAGVLFWGLQTGLLAFAVPVACVLEGGRFTGLRWDLSRTDFHRASDLNALLFASLVVYMYATREARGAIMGVFQWMPLTFVPLMLAQMFSAQGKVDVSAFFLSLRKRALEKGERRGVEVSYLYLAACILCASAANIRTPRFYICAVLLVCWALWRFRPARTPAYAWAGLMALAAGIGYLGHNGLNSLQGVLERRLAGLIYAMVEGSANPLRSQTAIGHIGMLKLSDRIILRVKASEGAAVPDLLREASYNRYWNTRWLGKGKTALFEDVAPGTEEASWRLGAGPKEFSRVTVSGYFPRGRGVLALPDGTFAVDDLLAAEVKRNRLGAVHVTEGPDFASYSARFAPSVALDAPPDKDAKKGDLAVPGESRVVMEKIAGELGLRAEDPLRAMKILARFFDENFKYSIYQKESLLGVRPLEDFLLKTRAGHCEYFATATVLLLRAAGIPARYAVGYSVSEYSGLEGAYVVRERHAHAWALAHDGSAWRVLDTTPGTWAAIEEDRSSRWQPLTDLWAWAKFKFTKWRWRRSEGGAGKYVVWLVLPMSLFLIWRFSGRLKRARAEGEAPASRLREAGAGLDSEFYEIIRALEADGLGRHAWEPVFEWLTRLEEVSGRAAVAGLRPLAELHVRYRFDPKGLSADERKNLQAGAREWADAYRRR